MLRGEYTRSGFETVHLFFLSITLSFVLINLKTGELSAGPILSPPSDFDLGLEAEKEPELTYENLGLQSPNGLIPGLWHTKITGADLAKDFLDDKSVTTHDVVIIDSGADRGVLSHIEKPHRPVRKITRGDYLLSLDRPLTTGLLRFFGGFLDQQTGNSVLYGDLNEEIVDPREYDIPETGTHGEHVAGLVGGDNRPFGVSSVAQVYSLNIFDTPAYTTVEDTLRLLDSLESRDWEPTTFNLSIDFSPVPAMIAAYNRVFEIENIMAVMAAGNNGQRLHNGSTQTQMNVLAIVGAFSPTGMLSGFSNFGETLDFVAPGEDILSYGQGLNVEGDEIEAARGTSMATPQVTGTVANIRAILPEITQDEVYEILQATAWDLQIPGHDENTGHGLINTLKATRAAYRMRERPEQNAYNFEEVSIAKLVQASKSDLFTGKAYELMREAALLSDRMEDFSMVAALYSQVFPCFSKGLEFMIRNRPQTDLSSIDKLNGMLDLTTHMFAHTQASHGDILPVLRNLSHPDVILALNDVLPDHDLVHAVLALRMKDIGGMELFEEFQLAVEEKKARLLMDQEDESSSMLAQDI